MNLSHYIKTYLLNDIILLAIVGGFIYLAMDTLEKDKLEEETTVELVPMNIHPEDDIG